MGDAAGITARPVTVLMVGYPAYAAGVTNHAGVLRPVLILFVAWVIGFLALSRLAWALIQ